MKKSIIVFVMLIVFILIMFMFVSRLEGAEIHGNMQFGYIAEIEGFEAEMNIQYLLWHWFEFYVGINVLMESVGDGFFYPFNDRYSIGIKANITEHIYVDGYHHCSHWVSSAAHRSYYDRFTGGNKTSINIGVEW